ncbi:MAG: hypothetical protein AAF617_04190 [Bacteroidota bacterium]
MKRKNLRVLSLHKSVVSTMNSQILKGGSSAPSAGCGLTNVAQSCDVFACGSGDCRSVNPPDCFARESENYTCTGAN